MEQTNMNTVIKYPGSKWSLADWIIRFFPKHHTYLEPFFGSGAVLFNKPRSCIETVNDLDGNVTNFFRWVKDDPEKLAHEIYYTPYARQVYEEASIEAPADSLANAANFCIRCNMGHGFRTTGEKVGWKTDIQGRERAYAAKEWCELPEKIIQAAERLRGVQIENRPALDLIRRYNHKKVLIYLDPPYMPGTRHGKQYRCEMYSQKAHEELLEAVLTHKGPVLISGYATELYQDLLKHWHREETSCRTQSGKVKTENLWMNFKPEGTQLSFDWTGEVYG